MTFCHFCSSLISPLFSLLQPPSPSLLPSQMSCIQPPLSPTTPPTRRGGDRQGSEYRWGQGQCFSLTNGLAWEETWDPCSGRPTARAHEEWGYCQVLSPPSPSPPPPPSPPQAGTSAALLPDRTALIGTPGPHTWRGTVFAVSTSDVSIPNLHTSSFNLFAPNTTHSSFLRVSPLTAHPISLHRGLVFITRAPQSKPPATHSL